MKLRPIDLTYSAIFVCLMAIGANITVWFPFLAVPIGGTSVPLSLQSFFATLAGLMLGRKIGSVAIATYLFVGLAGVPVFSKMSASPVVFLTPTGGFIISFLFMAFFAGWIAESSKRPTFSIYLLAAVCGIFFNYGIGVTYMYMAMNTWLEVPVTYTLTWMAMVPFLIKDTALACLAAAFMIRLTNRIPTIKTTAKAS